MRDNNKKSKLSLEDKEALAQIAFDADAMAALQKLFNAHIEDFASSVLSLDLANSTDRELILRKARHDGAFNLAASVVRHLVALKAKQDV